MEEIWKPIKNFEDRYEISNFGNIKTLKPWYNKTNGYKKKRLNKYGYLRTNLYNGSGKTIPTEIHKLVATHFLENPNNYTEINHKDENKLNNRVDNLEWCTVTYNNRYSSKKGKKHHRGGVNQYDLQHNFIKYWKSMKLAEKELKITKGKIYYGCKKMQKTVGGFIWEYADK